MTTPRNDQTDTPHTEQASRILDLCRELRILDSSTYAGRQELDEIATLVVAASPLEAIPGELRSRLRAATGRLDEVEARREIVRHELEQIAPIAPTVLVRV